MAATVLGGRKRGPTAFLDDPFPAPPHLSKRGRCSPSAAIADLGVSLEFDPVDALHLIFPDADPQILRNYLEASGNVLDAAIRAYKDNLASGSTELASSTDSDSAPGDRGNNVFCSQVAPDLSAMNIPSDLSEWAELFVTEMSSASDLVDAKNRSCRILDFFNKSSEKCRGPDATQKIREEHKILKQMAGVLLEQNSILKRAFRIQHNRLMDNEKVVQEQSQFKQTVEKYKEQIKALEDKNYVLAFHLAQANQRSSIPGHCHPDVF